MNTNNSMSKKFSSITASVAALILSQPTFAHPGHSADLFHSHDSLTLTVMSLGIVVAVGSLIYTVHTLRKQNKTQKVKVKAETRDKGIKG
ncbi:MAG: hypothetical protein MI976_10020 [Pseudomonadales bacterium]|nr:hypothetical protein [Pseudomonadales bacterium]